MKGRSLCTGVTALLFLIALGASCWADEFDNVRDRIRQYIDKEGVPSISLAVVKGDKIVWEDGFGWTDVENRVRATPHTAYMLGSVSKPITATVLMLLAERKLVDLDRPANDYLGENKIRSRLGDASRVTIRQILQHTSGLPNYGETFYADESDRPRSVEFLVRQYGWTMIRQGRFHYSNLGYTLLGEIAAQVSGKTFAELAKQELFVPLGMEQAFVPTHIQRPMGAALRYATDDARLPEYISGQIPAADIHGSAHDLALFALLHLKAGRQRLLPDKAIDAMWEHPVPIPTFKYAYGLGWSVGVDAKGRRHVFHGGGFAGCDAHLSLLPEKNLAVVILVNQTRKWPGTAVTQDLLDLTLASLLGEEVKDVRLEFGEERPSRSRFGSEVQGVWRGTVATPKQALPVALTFKDSGEVTAVLGKQAETPVKEVKYAERIFLGRMQGDIGVEDAARRSYHLDWDLTIVDDKLCGVLYVIGSANSRGVLLPCWAELERGKE